MSERRIGRKDLFDAFRRAAREPDAARDAPGAKPAGFSLDAFYRERRERGETTGSAIPAVRMARDLPVVETSRVGVDRPSPAASRPGQRPPGAALGGKVRVRTHACLAWQRSFCTTCSERCPERAIVVEQGRPRVDEDRCTGCGECVRVCPAPVNGFDVLRADLGADNEETCA